MMEDEGDTIVFAAISTFMRKDLQRNENFCETVLPRFSPDEFRGHFRMTEERWKFCVERLRPQAGFIKPIASEEVT